MRIASVGHAIFAATFIVFGILSLIKIDYIQIWEGVPKAPPIPEVLGYLCVGIYLACGIGLFWRRAAVYAARALLVYFLLWMVEIIVRHIIPQPLVEVSYQNWGETAVMVAGGWVLYAWFATDWDRRWLGFAVGHKGVRIARVFYGLAMLAFGLSHFFYLNLTAPLIPGWLPWHVAWAYFFGATYLAAGIAMLLGVYARLAATLSALQMGLFTLLVWIPVVATGRANAGQWGEFVLSWALTAGAWVVADSCRGVPWFALRGRWRDSEMRALDQK